MSNLNRLQNQWIFISLDTWYEPNYWHSWPSRSVPIQSCSLVANLMGMKPYHLTGYETGYDSESSYSGYDVNDRVGFNGPIAVGAC